MLYIAPLFWLGKPSIQFGYADDIGLLAISTDLQSNCEALQAALQEALDWGLAEGITFDPKKSELIYSLGHDKTLHQRTAPKSPPATTRSKKRTAHSSGSASSLTANLHSSRTSK